MSILSDLFRWLQPRQQKTPFLLSHAQATEIVRNIQIYLNIAGYEGHEDAQTALEIDLHDHMSPESAVAFSQRIRKAAEDADKIIEEMFCNLQIFDERTQRVFRAWIFTRGPEGGFDFISKLSRESVNLQRTLIEQVASIKRLDENDPGPGF